MEKERLTSRVHKAITYIKINGITKKALINASKKFDVRQEYLLKVGGWEKLTDKGRSR